MGILSKLRRNNAELKEGGYSFSTTDQVGMSRLGAMMSGSNPTVTGKNVNETTAMGITTVFACGRLLAETMGAMPSAFYEQQKSGNLKKIDDYPLGEVLIHQPNSDMNGLEFREARTVNRALRGNSFAIIERRGNGDVSSLYPVPANVMRIKKDSSTDFETKYGVPDRGKIEWLPADKIWHQKLFSFDGLIGLSPLSLAREAFALAMAGEEFNARLFAQGLMPSARVSIPNWLTDDQRKVANQKMLEMHTGVQNMGKPMLLEGGMKVESGLLTPDDAQFLQLRQFSVVELCRLLGVKPHMIAALEAATDNNIEKLSLEFVTYTMLPYVRGDETAARKLLKVSDKNKIVYRYNMDGLLRADSTARANLYSILLQNGVYTRNEVRALENRNTADVPEMNDYTVQLNMTLIQLLEQITRANAAPVPPAAPLKSAGDVQNIHVDLPESFKHELAQSIEVPGLVGMVDAVKQSNDNNTATAELMIRNIQDMTKEVARNNALLEENNRIGLMPVKAQFDKDGNPIGTKKVESLH